MGFIEAAVNLVARRRHTQSEVFRLPTLQFQGQRFAFRSWPYAPGLSEHDAAAILMGLEINVFKAVIAAVRNADERVLVTLNASRPGSAGEDEDVLGSCFGDGTFFGLTTKMNAIRGRISLEESSF